MKLLANSQGKILVNSQGKAYVAPQGAPEPPKFTGHVDTVGLTALGWDADDIAWLQANVWWNAEDDAYWAVSEANLAFGPNGATPLTWATRSTIQYNVDVRYFPKLTPTAFSYAFNEYICLYAIPTHGWTIGNNTTLTYAFASCSNLRSVGDLGALNTSTITNLSYAFLNCYNLLTPGDLSSWDVDGVTSFANLFNGCKAMVSCGDLSEWDTASATDMARMFNECNHLSSIGDVSNWNTSLVTNFNAMFGNCYTLYSMEGISDWNVKKMSSLYYTFDMNIRQTTIDLSGWDLEGLTNSGTGESTGGFSGCRATARLVLGPKFFSGTASTFYFDGLRSWNRDSIYESLYTNQTLRDSSSPAKTIRIYRTAYDALSAQDITDITSKNFTLTRI